MFPPEKNKESKFACYHDRDSRADGNKKCVFKEAD